MSTSEKERPEVLSSEEVFGGRLVSVVRDTVREGELTYVREVVRHPGGAGIVPVFDDGTVALVRQYRHPAVRYVLELPAGKLDEEGESVVETARRELAEEIGKAADTWSHLKTYYSSPGFSDEEIHLYEATGLRDADADADEHERIDIEPWPLHRLDELIEHCADGKSLVGLLELRRRL